MPAGFWIGLWAGSATGALVAFVAVFGLLAFALDVWSRPSKRSP